MPKYDAKGLKHGIERCNANINVLKSAIKRERDTIKQYEKWICDAEANEGTKSARDKFVEEQNAS